MKRIRKTIVLLATLAPLTAACDAEPEDVGSDVEALEDADVDEEEGPGTFASVYEPFDPEQPDEETRVLARQLVTVRAVDGIEMTAEVQHEAEKIQLRFAHTLAVAKGAPYFSARSADAEKIEVTYLGKGVLAEPSDEPDEVPLGDGVERSELPAKYQDDATWITGFSPSTNSEFEVRIPKELAEIVGVDAEMRGANRSTEVPDDPGELLLSARHQVGNFDTRVMKGALNTRQSSSNLKKIASLSGCTAALVGPRHLLTSAHCLYRRNPTTNLREWRRRTIRMGRNGTDHWGDAVVVGATPVGSSNTMVNGDDDIYWISSLYKDAVDNGGSSTDFIAYDIGVVVTPNDYLATNSGWFGYAVSNVSHDDMYNRGYAGCSSPSFPGDDGPPIDSVSVCNRNHLYGDSNLCGTGAFSSRKDSYGYSLFGYHSCDANAGHSGSPLYRNSSSLGWVVRGIHKGSHRDTANDSDSQAWLSFNLITRSRANLISFYKSAYP